MAFSPCSQLDGSEDGVVSKREIGVLWPKRSEEWFWRTGLRTDVHLPFQRSLAALETVSLWGIAFCLSLQKYSLDFLSACLLQIQDSFITVSDWPFWVTWRWYHSWWRTFYWHRRYTRVSDRLLTVGICWEKRAWSCRSHGEQSQNSPGAVTSQAVYRLSRKGKCVVRNQKSLIHGCHSGKAKGSISLWGL